jgi:hypothetical protein
MDVIIFKRYACNLGEFKFIYPPSARYLNRIKCSSVEGLIFIDLDVGLLGCVVVGFCRRLQTFRRNVSVPKHEDDGFQRNDDSLITCKTTKTLTQKAKTDIHAAMRNSHLLSAYLHS